MYYIKSVGARWIFTLSELSKDDNYDYKSCNDTGNILKLSSEFFMVV